MKKKESKIINFYKVIPKDYLNNSENPNYGKTHYFNIPFRGVVVAPSGSGKTNFIINLISAFSANKGTFNTIQIICKNKDEPLYRWIQEKGVIVTEGIETIPDLDKFDKNENHLIIFDDLLLEKNQKDMINYYIRARKLNVSVLYLSQSYFSIPKIIRTNSNYLIILKMGGLKDVKLIISEYSLDLSKEELLDIYRNATKEKLNPLIIINDESDINKKYMSNLTTFISP